MVMANYNEFSNNNYLPGFYQDMAAAPYPSYPPVTQFRNPVPTQNSFTFTSPTQVSTLGTPRPSIQTTSCISNLSAPGVGASWQHSIPVTMPWMDINTPRPQGDMGTATVFTGLPYSYFPEPQPSCQPQPSFRRPKRRALEPLDEAPVSKVYLCADQFANMKISQGAQKSCGPMPNENVSSNATNGAGLNSFNCHGDAEGWQRFREVESRLDVDIDEGIDVNFNNNSSSSDSGPRLKIAEGIIENNNSSPILPRKVIEDLNKPCMQIVLWKSPEDLIQNSSEENQTTTTDSTTTTNTFTTSNHVSSQRFPEPLEDNNNLNGFQDAMMQDGMSDSSFSSFPPSGSHTLQTPNFPAQQSEFSRPNLSGRVFNSVNTSSSGNVVGVTDIFDSMDDDMQL